MNELTKLANLLNEQNIIGNKIAEIIGRPAQAGHIGEYIASKIFDLELNKSAAQAGMDGFFRRGTLSGKSVDVKYYGKHERLHNFSAGKLPDYYLIMTGQTVSASSSRGKTSPFTIESVFFFDARLLVTQQIERGVQIGIAASIPKALWAAAEI